jgi:predicted nuclease of restriction endonuclease-like (RecB) superfamily
MSAELLASPPEGYIEWVKDIKERIRSAQQKAVFAANSAMLAMYWQIGRDILERQHLQGWGSKVVDRLAGDLCREFPEIKGFSATNLKYMRRFAEECPNYKIGQQPVDQLPWSHLIRLITKVAKPVEREWYAHATIEYGC